MGALVVLGLGIMALHESKTKDMLVSAGVINVRRL